MSGFGVRRLVVINSGGYRFADVAMDGPIHLVAPNNRGKSTLVNALQFLYVDNIRKMRFPRSPDETQEHYFGSTPSYLLFECVTAMGPQSLLVVGRGRLTGSAFARYVFSGGYRQEDFIDAKGLVAEFEIVKARLADRSLSEIKPPELWEVLSTTSRRARSEKGGQSGPRLPQLGLLPIRALEDYRSFREAYVRLLSLSNMSAAELRQLLIDCHASEVGELKLDVAADYRDEFDRAERTEKRLEFLEAAGQFIDDGEQRRERLQMYGRQIAKELPAALVECTSLLAAMRACEGETQHGLAELDKRQARINLARSELQTMTGRVEARIEQVQADLSELDALHSRWATTTPQMLQAMRDNADTTRDGIASQKERLRQAGTFDREAMRRSVRDLQRDADAQERSLANWETQVRGWLADHGIKPDTIVDAFRVLNPGLLRLVVGDEVEVTSPQDLLARIESIAQCVEHDSYDDGSVRFRVSAVGGPESSALDDPEAAKESLRIIKARLQEELERLHVADNTVAAQEALRGMEKRYAEQSQKLAEHDDYHRRWELRPKRTDELAALSAELDGIRTQMEVLRSQELEIHEERSKRGQDAKMIRECNALLLDSRRKLDASLEAAGITELRAGDTAPQDLVAPLESLVAGCSRCVAAIDRITEQAGNVKFEREKITSVQRRIADCAREHSRGQYFVGDEEEDWNELIATRRAMPELRQANEQSWDALFTTMRARLDALMRGVRSISNAASRVNGAMKRHRVSNLREVQLDVTRQHEACDLLESLTGPDGLFADRDALDRARSRLRLWIKEGKIIRLQDLFGIRIRVQGIDEQWSEAKSLDEIGSTGTGMTAKAMIFIQLVRAVVTDERYRLHFYLDETGQLDDRNLHATTAMAVQRGVVPITAEPRVRAEPLAHPTVTVYSLGQDHNGRFYIDAHRTLRATRRSADEGSEQDVTD